MKKIILLLLLILTFSACASRKKMIEAKEDYFNVYNFDFIGTQEEKYVSAKNLYLQGNYKASLQAFQDLLSSFVSTDNQEGIVHVLLYISSIFSRQKDYEKALLVLNSAKKRVTLILDESSRKKRYFILIESERLRILMDKKEVFAKKGDLLKLLLKNLEDAEDNSSRSLLIRAHRNLGVYYLSRDMFKQAERSLKIAFVLANKSRKLEKFVESAILLSRVYRRQTLYTDALDKLFLTYRLFQREGSELYLLWQAFILKEVAFIYEQAKEYKNAAKYYLRAYEMILANSEIELDTKRMYLINLKKKLMELANKKELKGLEPIFYIQKIIDSIDREDLNLESGTQSGLNH